ncbi:hypothetical protein J4Q44_G00291620 [Coregonus suidteri]|uniref:Uncharacterized protein n=1 Tax=Coregonus suidteri TaxID=861788 RepID=A0AAN8L4J2_9TELE
MRRTATQPPGMNAHIVEEEEEEEEEEEALRREGGGWRRRRMRRRRRRRKKKSGRRKRKKRVKMKKRREEEVGDLLNSVVEEATWDTPHLGMSPNSCHESTPERNPNQCHECGKSYRDPGDQSTPKARESQGPDPNHGSKASTQDTSVEGQR